MLGYVSEWLYDRINEAAHNVITGASMKWTLLAIALGVMLGSYIHSIKPEKPDNRVCTRWSVWKSDIPEISVAECLEYKDGEDKTR